MIPINYNKSDWQTRKNARLEYITKQKGLCYYCEKPLNGKPHSEVLSRYINWNLFPKDFTKHPIHLHHDHVSGMTIGAVHSLCNAVLWQYYGE